jgi:phage tail sheath protein FI
MTFQVSPGVNVSEVDQTTVVPAVSTSSGAVAGPFEWGPIDTVRQISNENELVQVFGKPATNTAPTFFTAANFLAYANDLRVVRSANTATYNAYGKANTNLTVSGTRIANEEAYEATISATGVANTVFAARYAGTLGNTLKVAVWANNNTANFSSWTYASLFDKAPGTSYFIKSSFPSVANTANDELHIVVVDEDGAWTGAAGTVLEKFAFLSKATNAKNESGESIYWKDVIFRKSKFIYVTGKPEAAGGNTAVNWNTEANNSSSPYSQCEVTKQTYSFEGGTLAATADADNQTAYDKIKNAEEVEVQLVMTAGHNDVVSKYVIDNIGESRRDCVVFVSPALANVQAQDATTAVINYRNNALGNVSSSYAVMDSGWKYQYDKYNDLYRWIPLNGDVAGLCARTDTDRDPWFSPAGLIRGQIKNVLKLAYNPNKANRDELYKNGINPVVSFTGEGTMLFGDKTLLGRPSAFDRINVRRLFIVLEKSIAKAARSSLFEFNDEFTRAQFVNLVEPFLRTVQGRRGVYDYRVICDETNNTAEVIDRNEFVGDIYVKPAKSINFIQLNFVAVRSGVAFEEVVGKF